MITLEKRGNGIAVAIIHKCDTDAYFITDN